MTTHSLTFNLTTEQVNSLNSALSEHHEANTDAINSGSLFSNDEMSRFAKQCEALDILISSIKNIVSEPTYAK
jgi:diphthamide synthase (EF-2-diphthine--ammonia ligase)